MVLNFNDSNSDLLSKEVKHACLNELLDYFVKPGFSATDVVYSEVINMVS